MPAVPPPRRPLSPWPVGAAVLAVFVGLSVVLRGSLAAVQVMIVVALGVGLAITWNRARTPPQAAAPTTGGPGADKPTSVASSVVAPSAPLAGEPSRAVLSVDEVATYLGSDAAAVTAELNAGRMPGNKIGGVWRVRKLSLDAWLDGAYSGPTGR